MRPLKEGRTHSGSPFRQMLEDPLWTAARGAFFEFASQGGQCSGTHEAYLREQGASITWLSDILRARALSTDELAARCGKHTPCAPDVKLDAVSGAHTVLVLVLGCFARACDCRVCVCGWVCVCSGLGSSKLLEFAAASPAAAQLLRLINSVPTAQWFVSFDIDSIAGDDCPGVSCPATIGLSALDAVRWGR